MRPRRTQDTWRALGIGAALCAALALSAVASAAHAQSPEGHDGGEGRWPAEVMALLSGAEAVEVRSLYPGPRAFLLDEPQALRAAAEGFDPVEGFAVLGIARLAEDAEVEAALEPLRQAAMGAATGTATGGTPSLARPCVWPRHSVRVFKDGTRLDAVLGFVCGVALVEVNAPGQPTVRLRLGLGDDPRAAEALDASLRAQGVLLPDAVYSQDTTQGAAPAGRLDVEPEAR